MKKYRIHFVYIMIIVVLAVMSRLKTNELSDDLQKAEEMAELSRAAAENAKELAEMASREAQQQAERAQQQAEMAHREAERALEALAKCK